MTIAMAVALASTLTSAGHGKYWYCHPTRGLNVAPAATDCVKMKLGMSGWISRSVIGLWVEPELVRVERVEQAATTMILTVVTIQTQGKLLAALAAAADRHDPRFFILTRRVN